jgi:hypothetical protein
MMDVNEHERLSNSNGHWKKCHILTQYIGLGLWCLTPLSLAWTGKISGNECSWFTDCCLELVGCKVNTFCTMYQTVGDLRWWPFNFYVFIFNFCFRV